MGIQVAWAKIKELEAEARDLQGALEQVESNLALTLEREKEVERKTVERIQDAKYSSVEEIKVSPIFAEEMAGAVEAFKVFAEYRSSHVTFSENIFCQAHKEGWINCRKSIEEEYSELDLIFLDYKDEDEEDDKVHTASELSIFKKENVAEPPSSSTADADPSEPPLDITP